ncbi:MAG: MBL fold metallo-hydrolase, partial [Candidatus Diapherotrites archaeon]|nr:MBL fold metallo-hydrolase [Candidatus Diapherotrites archaeon]
MRFTFLGAAREVGRSSVLFESGNDRMLFDNGAKVGEGRSQPSYPMSPQGFVDATILSHGHLDHVGNAPATFKNGRTLIYATPPTLELADLLWRDSLKIARYEGFTPPYGPRDIQKALQNTLPMNYNQEVPVADESYLKFIDAGHIPGAGLCHVETSDEGKTRNVLYTGDFNTIDTRLHAACDPPKMDLDALIIESTYYNREHSRPRKQLEDDFKNGIAEVTSGGGTALVASFAVGRAQELIQILTDEDYGVPIYLDGMAQKATRIALDNSSYVRDASALRGAAHKVINVKDHRHREELIKEPCIIISTSGMVSGGPIMYYLLQKYKDVKSKLFLTGYQAEKTGGRSALENNKVEIDGVEVKLKIPVEKFDFSAHAAWSGLKYLVEKTNPEHVFCIHGEDKSCTGFAN